MDVSLKSSVNSSVAAHTGYSWKGLPPDLRSPTISSDPHGRNHQVHSNYIRPIASSREQRTDHWQGKKTDGFLGPPAASGPNWRQSQPFGIGDRAPIPAARPTHIRQGLPIPKPSYEDRWSNIGFENDSVKGQDVPPSSGFRSLHGTYDNSWYSPSPQSYCARADTFQNKVSLCYAVSVSLSLSLCLCLSVRPSVRPSLSLSLSLTHTHTHTHLSLIHI